MRNLINKPIKILISLLILFITILLLFSIVPKSYISAEASGSINTDAIYNFYFYKGSSYYRQVSLKISKLYSTFVSNSKTLTFELVYSGDEHGTGSVRAGATLTFELIDENGNSQVSVERSYQTDFGWDDNWATGGGTFTITVPEDGKYKIRVTGSVWRSGIGADSYYIDETSSSYFIIDTTKPTISPSSGGYYNSPFTVTMNDANLVGFWYKTPKDSNYMLSYSSSYNSFSAEGVYYFYAYDKAGNESDVYSYYYDTTMPNIVLSGVSNGGFTYNNVKVSVSDNRQLERTTYILNGGTEATFSSGTTFSEEGQYIIKALDKAGNSSSVTFTIDKTAPVFSVNAYYKGGQSVSISIIESNLDVVYLDGTEQGSVRSWNTNNLSEGSHTIKVVDLILPAIVRRSRSSSIKPRRL